MPNWQPSWKLELLLTSQEKQRQAVVEATKRRDFYTLRGLTALYSWWIQTALKSLQSYTKNIKKMPGLKIEIRFSDFKPRVPKIKFQIKYQRTLCKKNDKTRAVPSPNGTILRRHVEPFGESPVLRRREFCRTSRTKSLFHIFQGNRFSCRKRTKHYTQVYSRWGCTTKEKERKGWT